MLTVDPAPPFVTESDVDSQVRRLRVIADVTADVSSDRNLLPIYDRVTDWAKPARRLRGGDNPLDMIAIDNLPSLLPREASETFSADLLPLLLALDPESGPWQRTLARFHRAAAELSHA